MISSIKGYIYLAIGLLIFAGAVGLYAKGRLDSTHAAEMAQLQTKVNTMEAQAKADRAAARLDAIQAKLDADDLSALADRAQTLQEKLDAPDTVCLDGRDTDLLRDYWGPDPTANPK